MQFWPLLFGGILFLGLWMPAHGFPLVGLGILCGQTWPGCFGAVAALWGGIELVLYFFGFDGLLMRDQGVVDTYVRRPGDPNWKHRDSHQYDTSITTPEVWILAAVHSFVVGATFTIFQYFDLFTYPSE